MADFVEAATSLVVMLNKRPGTNPQSHSVVARTETNDDGSFKRSIQVSWHPNFKGSKDLPDKHLGWPITVTPWPSSL